MPPKDFRIQVEDSVLADLRERLARTRWAEPLPGEPWERGADVAYVRELCEYWRDRYDWRKHEAALNEYPQFVSTVDGVDFHYWHVRGKGPSPTPLLLVHGWPGSIYEFHHLIGPLTDPAAHGGNAADAFDVVVPALPGFGFSSKPREAGWGPARTARAFHRLMTEELGHPRYGAQGGDWGAIITAILAAENADAIIGAHFNVLFLLPTAEEAQTAGGKAFAERMGAFTRDETAYQAVHATKPVSLGIAQSDSPAGIAAWITEKFRTWSDCGGDIESVYTKDQLLTNIMFYWAPNSIASAANIYGEARREGRAPGWPKIEAPVGVAMFPKELAVVPRQWAEARMNVVHWTDMPRGGHFAAMEQPELLLEDVRDFFRPLR